MGYVIVTRNPSNKKLIAISDEEDMDRIAEFATETEATEAASNTTVCKAWGYQILETD